MAALKSVQGRARLSSARRESARSFEFSTMPRAEDRRALPFSLTSPLQISLIILSSIILSHMILLFFLVSAFVVLPLCMILPPMILLFCPSIPPPPIN